MKQEIKERIERIRKGEVPGGYRKTKVGIIPEGWDVKTLGEIVRKFVNGGTPSRQFENYWNGNIPWITGADILNQEVSVIRRYITNDAVKNSSTNVIEKGNLLLVSRTGVGKLAIAPFDIAISQDFTGIYVKNEELLGEYLYSYFDVNQSTLQSQNQGTSIQGITRNTLSAIQIPLPPLSEQQKIAEILSTWDGAIELKQKLIEEKKEFKRGLMQRLLVGKIRFKEHVKNTNLQEAKRYSTLPEDWSIKKASSIFSKISKKNNCNEQLLSATQNNGVMPRDMLDGDVMSPSGDTNSYKLVEEGDFVISLRTFQGGIEYSSYRGIISPAYTVLKNKIPICMDFYRYIFKSKLFIDRLASSVIGIRDGKQISYDDFSFMFLPYPELKEQEKIAFTLKNLDYNIKLLNLELNQLKEQKKGLMQLLLTGIVRVNS